MVSSTDRLFSRYKFTAFLIQLVSNCGIILFENIKDLQLIFAKHVGIKLNQGLQRPAKNIKDLQLIFEKWFLEWDHCNKVFAEVEKPELIKIETDRIRSLRIRLRKFFLEKNKNIFQNFRFLCDFFSSFRLTYKLELIAMTTNDALTDIELIARINRTNDPHWFGILYDRYSKRVYNKCLMFVKDPTEAEDLAHDIFVKAFLHLKQFKGSSLFSTWLFSITYNFCISNLRSRKEMREMPETEIACTQNEVPDEDFLALRVMHLEQALTEISPLEKMILLMKYQDDMSIKEIQEALNLGESAVKMRLKRSKNRVVELCNNYKQPTT